MDVSTTAAVVILDGRNDSRNLLSAAYESLNQCQLMAFGRAWHKVTVFNGWVYGKEYVLHRIFEAIAPEEIIPFLYQQDGDNAVFFVNDHVNAIRKLCRNLKVYHGSGFFLLQIQLCYPMGTKICMRSILGNVISKNMYNASEKSLQLQNFHKDKELEQWMYCPLHLRRIVYEVECILFNLHHLSSLREINLSKNNLTSVRIFSYLIQIAHNLRVIDLSDNMIPDLSSFYHIRGLQLHELILDGNPLCGLFSKESKYIEEVRALFPTIVKLDGITLPREGFPVGWQNYLCNPDGEPFVEQFITYYFKMYDGWSGSRTRLNLAGTYTKGALFSLSAADVPRNVGLAVAFQPAGRLNKYFSESRNLLKISDYIKTHKSLIHGREQIVKFISDLPLTQHDRKSISVDLTKFDATQAVMTVRGIFRELGSLENSLCSFSRVFVLSRSGNNFFITNDMLFITNATGQQAEVSLKSLPPLPASPSNDLSYLDGKNCEIRQNMVEELAKITEMNLRWSRKCLVETEWDFQEALKNFMDCYEKETIPPHVFKS
ncbi:nuclear RNA export factor 1-like [Hetaerina americana]|uniref:nuclear RNA export factor 1-like n=1 Tax=Hetaerina americana TaxID=62018 RepID=UPI003A7F58E9